MSAGWTVGRLRPTQLVTTFGPGAVVDLPDRSVVIGGLEWWRGGRSVYEPRLQTVLGVDELRLPPIAKDGGHVPCLEFPRWRVCSRDGLLLATRGCPTHAFEYLYPARLIQACSKGHLDDFPWNWWLHRGVRCGGQLRLSSGGRSATLADLLLSCSGCSQVRSLAGATREDLGLHCSARRPWLEVETDGRDCDATPRGLLRGASNVYFPLSISALSIPPWTNPVQELLNPIWPRLAAVDSDERLQAIHELMFGDTPYDLFREAVAARRAMVSGQHQLTLKAEEFRAITMGSPSPDPDFEVAELRPPDTDLGIERVFAIERLREVVALKSFTRLDYPDRWSTIRVNEAPLSSQPVSWRPAFENRGEGILLTFDIRRLLDWARQPAVAHVGDAIERAFEEWQRARGLDGGTPPPRHLVFLHTLSHLAIRQLSLDSGYSSTSLRERLYVDEHMAGVLIYTASGDSDGSLGGLVAQGRPGRLGALLRTALDEATVCASDPLCAERTPRGGHLSAAACHACLLLPETSCEFGNRFLDRGTVVDMPGQTRRSFRVAPQG